MSDTDFSGLDFAAGDVVGLRYWTVVHGQWAAGRPLADPVALKSVYRDCLWTDSVNAAVCRPQGSSALHTMLRTDECLQQHHHDAENPYSGHAMECHRPHLQGIDPLHSCGFYAYTDRDAVSPFVRTDRAVHVAGVVQGWGLTVIGTKGFRCTYARILAITLPPLVNEQLDPARVRSDMAAAEHLTSVYPSAKVYTRVRDMLEAHTLHGLN